MAYDICYSALPPSVRYEHHEVDVFQRHAAKTPRRDSDAMARARQRRRLLMRRLFPPIPLPMPRATAMPAAASATLHYIITPLYALPMLSRGRRCAAVRDAVPLPLFPRCVRPSTVRCPRRWGHHARAEAKKHARSFACGDEERSIPGAAAGTQRRRRA